MQVSAGSSTSPGGVVSTLLESVFEPSVFCSSSHGKGRVGLLKRKSELSPVSQSCPNLPRLIFNEIGNDHHPSAFCLDDNAGDGNATCENCGSTQVPLGRGATVAAETGDLPSRPICSALRHPAKMARMVSPHHTSSSFLEAGVEEGDQEGSSDEEIMQLELPVSPGIIFGDSSSSRKEKSSRAATQTQIRDHLSITLPRRLTSSPSFATCDARGGYGFSEGWACAPTVPPKAAAPAVQVVVAGENSSPHGPSPRLPPTPCYDDDGQFGGPADQCTLKLLHGLKRWHPEVSQAATAAAAGMRAGKRPILADGCVSGTYYLPGPSGRFVALFKPGDEEAAAANNPRSKARGGLIKGGIGAGECAVRECIAWLLDEWGMAGVPPTAMAYARAEHGFRGQGEKMGSLQVYMRHECSAEDMGPSLFSLRDVHSIAVLDIRLCNQDRHCGNILVQKVPSILGSGMMQKNVSTDDHGDCRSRPLHHSRSSSSLFEPTSRVKLVPIDHGFCLPHPAFMSDTDFAWLHWPQSHEPINPWMRAQIASIDVDEDICRIREALGGLVPSEEYLLTLRIGTALLQKGVAMDLSLNCIGNIMTRDDPDVPCELEKAIASVLDSKPRVALNDSLLFMESFNPLLDDIIRQARANRNKASRSLST